MRAITHCFYFFLWLFIGLLLLLPSEATATQETLVIEQAKVTYADTTTPPDFTHAFIVKLRHFWDKEGFYGHAWYQVTFPTVSIENLQTWAIYLPQINMNAEVWLNDVMIGSGGRMIPPITRNWHSPLLFTVPTKLLNPVGEKLNTIHIHVVSFANRHGNLGEVRIGLEKDLRPIFNTEKFNSVTVRIIGSTLIFVLVIMLLPIWVKRRNSVYFWYMLACLMWISGSINTYISNIPLPEPVWEKIIHIILGWVAIAFAFFIVRLTGNHFPRLEKSVLVIMAIFNIVMVLIPITQLFSLAIFYLLFGIVIGISSIFFLFYKWWKERKQSYVIVIFSLIIIAICAIHDLAIQANWWGIKGRIWLDYSIPLVFLMIGYLMVSRFLAAIEESETLNIELESRVEKAQHKIETNYQRIISLETEQAANNERERIYRNLHDDLGSKLLSLVYRSDTKKMADLARSALNDLRVIVSHKPIIKKSLIDEIKAWQKDCFTRCQESNQALEFNTQHIPNEIKLSNDSMDHLQRLLTEAVTNAIKHGQGNVIKITLQYRLSCLKVTVTDNGNYTKKPWKEGRGLSNMRYRTDQLKGKVHWNKDKLSNEVSWIIPIMSNLA